MKICQSSQRTWFSQKSLQHFLFSEITIYRIGRRTSEKLVGSVWYLQHWSWYWWCLWYAVGCNLLLHRQPAYQSLYPMSGASSRCITLNFDELSLLKQWKQHKLLSSFPLLNSQTFSVLASLFAHVWLRLVVIVPNPILWASELVLHASGNLL